MKDFIEKYNIWISLALFYLTVADVIQSWFYLGENVGNSFKIKLFFFLHIAILTGCLIFFISNKNKIISLINKLKQLPIPNGAKWAIAIVLIGNLISIAVGRPSYPFYDVGMFRWTTHFKDAPKVVYKPKYFYWKDGESKILDLRKEGYYLLHEHFGLRYTHEFTFAATYHNKGQKENFDFIMQKMKERGIDTLWVGVHAVNYETKEVWFNTDLCDAIRINQTEKIHYGPIYIPNYQMERCNEN